MTALDPSSVLLLVLGLGAFALKAWALIDAATRPAAAFPAAGKLTKVIWTAILAVAVVFDLLLGFGVLGLFGLLGLIAAIVYLVDVRPAVREVRPGGSWG